MKATRNDFLRWRHTGDHPLDRCLLRDKALELAGGNRLTASKCSDNWLTCFLKRHCSSLDTEGHSGSAFRNWTDTMRSAITHKHKDLFRLEEVTVSSDITSRISSRTLEDDEPDAILKEATVLACCNASGTEKLPLLICGSYPAVIANENCVYSHSEDASINDTLFRTWLKHVNDRMSENNREILLMLRRNRASAFRGLELSNVRHLFLPDIFPALLRPLKRDIFHYVKTICRCRCRYVKGIKEEHGHRWNAESVIRRLVEAWRKVPRDLIIASFQRTSFRIDNCFLEIHCDACEDLKKGTSLKKCVTFDDKPSTYESYKQHKSISKAHEYNFENRQIITSIDDHFDYTINWKEKARIDEQAHENLKEICVTKKADRERNSSLKRSYDEARLSEDSYEEADNANSSNDPTSKNNKSILALPTPMKLPRIAELQAIENATQSSKFMGMYSTRAIVNAALTKSGRKAGRYCEFDKTVKSQKRNKNIQASSNKRLAESSSEVAVTDDNDIALQQVHDDGSPVDRGRKTNATISRFGLRDKTELADLNENSARPSRKSLKRRRSRFDNTEKSRNHLDDDEPRRKRSSPDSYWTNKPETTFVIGSSGFARIPLTIFDILNNNGVHLPRLTIRRSYETQRSIFTIRPRRD